MSATSPVGCSPRSGQGCCQFAFKKRRPDTRLQSSLSWVPERSPSLRSIQFPAACQRDERWATNAIDGTELVVRLCMVGLAAPLPTHLGRFAGGLLLVSDSRYRMDWWPRHAPRQSVQPQQSATQPMVVACGSWFGDGGCLTTPRMTDGPGTSRSDRWPARGLDNSVRMDCDDSEDPQVFCNPPPAPEQPTLTSLPRAC